MLVFKGVSKLSILYFRKGIALTSFLGIVIEPTIAIIFHSVEQTGNQKKKINK